MDRNYERVLMALRLMIANDNTEQYLDAANGEFDPNDENAHWLRVLQTAQQIYYDATGEVVANDMGVILIPGKANEDDFGKIIHAG
jgi:hypothetical protein